MLTDCLTDWGMLRARPHFSCLRVHATLFFFSLSLTEREWERGRERKKRRVAWTRKHETCGHDLSIPLSFSFSLTERVIKRGEREWERESEKEVEKEREREREREWERESEKEVERERERKREWVRKRDIKIDLKDGYLFKMRYGLNYMFNF